MNNFLRALFCCDAENDVSYERLFNVLDVNGCTMHDFHDAKKGYVIPLNDGPDVRFISGGQKVLMQLSHARYFNVELECQFGDEFYAGRIGQIQQNDHSKMIYFGIEASIFLSAGVAIAHIADTDLLFEKYHYIITQFIKVLSPSLGLIDYDADLLCFQSHDVNFSVGWGSYISFDMLNSEIEDFINRLEHIADVLLSIDRMGVLFFINPLAANQARTERHILADALIRQYLYGYPPVT